MPINYINPLMMDETGKAIAAALTGKEPEESSGPVSLIKAPMSEATAQAILAAILGGSGGGSVTPGTLVIVSGEMTDEQAAQFRENINAASSARQLPAVNESDEGKFLRVISGVWAAATVPTAETASF